MGSGGGAGSGSSETLRSSRATTTGGELIGGGSGLTRTITCAQGEVVSSEPVALSVTLVGQSGNIVQLRPPLLYALSVTRRRNGLY